MAMIAVAAVAVVAGVYAATRTISVPGQKLGDIAVQTAKEGEPRIIVWGIVRPIGGNLVAVQDPPRIVKKKQKSGGKGGGGSKTTTEVPYRTYAVGICEGPITGIRRVWRNNKLVFDATGSDWGKKNNGVFLQTARFYLGGWDQMPSPDLEAVFGAGNVPAMRGTAYMVMANEELADTGGAVPQWVFEVVRAEGTAITSRPYPVEVFEESDASAGPVQGAIREPPKAGMSDASDAAVSLLGATIESSVERFAYEEATDAGATIAFAEITSAEPARPYPPEATNGAVTVQSTTLKITRIRYQGYPPEATNAAVTLIGATLS